MTENSLKEQHQGPQSGHARIRLIFDARREPVDGQVLDGGGLFFPLAGRPKEECLNARLSGLFGGATDEHRRFLADPRRWTVQSPPDLVTGTEPAAGLQIVPEGTDRVLLYWAPREKRNSGKSFEAYFHDAPTMMILLDRQEGTVLDVNQAFLQRTGTRPEELTGQAFGQSQRLNGLFPGFRLPQPPGKATDNVTVQTEICSSDGTRFDGQVKSVRIDRDRDLLVINDVTQEADIRRALQRKSALEDILLEESSRLFCCGSTDFDEVLQRTLQRLGEFGRVDRTYIFLYYDQNRKMDNTHEWCAPGISPQKNNLKNLDTDIFPEWMASLFRGETIYIPVVGDLPPSWGEEKASLLAQEVKSLLVIPIIGGGKHYGFMGFDSVGNWTQWDEDARGLLGFFANNVGEVLARQEHEEKLRIASRDNQILARKADEANQAKSDFLARMSHELRTPLSSMIGTADMVLDSPLDSRQRRLIGLMRNSGGTLLRILNDLLDFSRIEAGQSQLRPEPFSPEELLAQTVGLFEPRAREKAVRLRSSTDGKLPGRLCGDAGRIGQILNNLVSNAVKYTDEGHVAVRMQVVEPDSPQKAPVWLVLSVEDTGQGMDHNERKHIFDDFYRGFGEDGTRPGTGLGLSICRRLAALMGGTITVNSRPGAGSRFEVRLPLEPVDDEDKSQTWEGLPVLVLQPDDRSSTTIKTVLEDWHFEQHHADNPGEAVAILASNREKGRQVWLSVVELDLLDGTPGPLKGKLLEELARVPVIFLSGTGAQREDLRLAGFPLAFQGFLETPLDPQEIRDCVGTSLGVRSVRAIRYDNPRLAVMSGARILVVEDIDINREIIVYLLRNIGIVPDEARNGREALEAIGKNRYDLVLMDIRMPGMDGYQATRIIREQFDAGQLPVVAMTAHGLPEHRQKSLEAGMQDHLTKPVSSEQLYGVLMKCLPEEQATGVPVVPETQKSAEPDGPADSMLDIPGLDARTGRQQMGGNEKLYRQTLVHVVRDFDGFPQKVEQCLRDGDRAAAIRLVHSLKSVGASVGAAILSARADRMETLLGEQNLSVQGLLQSAQWTELADQLDETLRGIRQAPFFPPSDQTQVKRPLCEDLDALDRLVGRLRFALMRGYVGRSRRVMGEIMAFCWPQPCQQLLQTVEDQVSRYRFDDALATLKSLGQTIRKREKHS